MTNTPPPNIVFIFPDQWRYDALSCLNHPTVHTPFSDQLVNEGALFTNAFSPSPICIPARACFMTGRTPWNAGRVGYQDGLPWPYRTTLPQHLRDNGYQTMCVGKTHFHPMRANLGFEVLRTYEASVREPNYQSHYHQWLERETNGQVKDIALKAFPNAWHSQPWAHDRSLHNTEWITREATDCLRHRDPSRPFMMQIGYHRPHPPFDPPVDVLEKVRRRPLPDRIVGDWATKDPTQHMGTHMPSKEGFYQNETHFNEARYAYYASVEHIDEQIGEVYWQLRELGLLKNTWIVVASDHGETLGDNYGWHKASLMRQSAGIPFIVRPPGNWQGQRGQHLDTPVDLSDLAPTMCAWANTNMPDADGKDITPLLEGTAIDREYIHGECRAPQYHQALRDERWTYIWDAYSGEERLFDREADPQETKNLIKHSDQADIWRQRMTEVLANRGDGLSDGQSLTINREGNTANPCLAEHTDPLDANSAMI